MADERFPHLRSLYFLLLACLCARQVDPFPCLAKSHNELHEHKGARNRREALKAFEREREENSQASRVKKASAHNFRMVASCLLGLAACTAVVAVLVVYMVERVYFSHSKDGLFSPSDFKAPDVDKKDRFIIPGAPYELPEHRPNDMVLLHRNVSLLLTKGIQHELHELQHPSNCKNRGYLYCQTPDEVRCLFTCHLRRIAACLISAVITGRTMVLHEKTGVFQTTPIWGKQLKEVGTRCTPGGMPMPWPQEGKLDDRILFVKAPRVGAVLDRQDFFPPAVPEELYTPLANITEAPAAWWTAQFMKYATRLSPKMNETLHIEKKRVNLSGPVVGIAFSLYSVMEQYQYSLMSDVDEYMKHVSYFYTELENQGIFVEKRKVFVATENAPFIEDLQEEYGEDYDITYLMELDDSEKNLTREIVELEILTEVDYLVCQFSNLMCQTAYELRLLKYPDRARHMTSIFDIYRFAYGLPNMAYATEDHEPDARYIIALEKGDRISLLPTLQDGELHGTNLRTGESGALPLEKISADVPIRKFSKD